MACRNTASLARARPAASRENRSTSRTDICREETMKNSGKAASGTTKKVCISKAKTAKNAAAPPFAHPPNSTPQPTFSSGVEGLAFESLTPRRDSGLQVLVPFASQLYHSLSLTLPHRIVILLEVSSECIDFRSCHHGGTQRYT